MGMVDRVAGMGLSGAEAKLNLERLRERIQAIEDRLESNIVQLLRSQGVRMILGTGRLKGPHEIAVETDEGVSEIEADAILVSTGSRPRVPDWAQVDGERILTTRDAVSAPRAARAPGGDRVGRDRRGVRPHVLVARQPGDPHRQPPAGAAAEGPRGRRSPGGRVAAPGGAALQGSPGRGRRPHRGRRGRALQRRPRGRRQPRPAGHRLDPQQRRARARRRRGGGRSGRLRAHQPSLRHQRAAHLRRRGPVGQAAAVVGGGDAGAQDRRARHGPAHAGPPPSRLRQGGVGDLHRTRDRRRGPGRGRRLRRGTQAAGDQGAVLGRRPRRSSTTRPRAS